MLATPVTGSPSPTIVSVKDFPLPSGDALTVFLDSNGLLYSNDSENPTDTTNLLNVTPGVQFKAETAFNKQWYAFFSEAEAAAFSDNPFVGVDVPAYYNGQDLFRVTSDAPGQGPGFASISVPPVNLVQSAIGGSLTVTGVVSSDEFINDMGTYWGVLIYTCSSAVPSSWAGQSVTITNLSGTNSSLANITGEIAYTEGNTFALYVNTYSFVNLSGQSATATLYTIYLGRKSNIVTAYVGPTQPPNMQAGFWASVQNADGSLMNGPNWDITTLARDSNGLVTVTISTQLTNLPVGASLYINPGTASYSGQVAVTNGSPVVNWSSGTVFDQNLVGQTITIDSIGYVVLAVQSSTTLTLTTTVVSSSSTYAYTASPLPLAAGYQTVYQVLSATGGNTVFTFQTLNTIPISATGGTVYQTWSPQFGTAGNAAQILVSALDPQNGWYFQFYQLGPDTNLDSTGGTPQAQIVAQAAPGARSGVVMFKSVDGAITAPSVPVTLVTIGGGNLLLAQNVPIGPSNTAQRIIALTSAEGSNFYYVTPATVPAEGGQGPSIATGTILNDNSSTSFVMDFSDTQLTSGTQIDIAGNNLFNQVVLAPCLGNIEYQSRMGWFGEINNVKNLLNMGFEGGFIAPTGSVSIYSTSQVNWIAGTQFNSSWVGSAIAIDGVTYTIATVSSPTELTLSGSGPFPSGTFGYSFLNPIGQQPLGWNTSLGDGTGTLVATTLGGFAYQMQGGHNSMIVQPCATDFYGAQILQPGQSYIFRFRGGWAGSVPPHTVPRGTLVVNIFSLSKGLLASADFAIGVMGQVELNWNSLALSAPMPTPMPADAMFELYLQGVPSGITVTIDELELIYENQPVSYDQMRLSYYQNPFGFDDVTGILSVDPAQSISGAFRQRGYLYLIGGDGGQSLFQSVNNGTGEPATWSVNEYVGKCGCSGPNAVDFGEEFAMWAGRQGIREFVGEPTAKKLSQEFAATWESMNWAAQTTIWLKNDDVDRLIFCGIPTGINGSPNIVLQMSYRLSDSAYNVPDPIHVSPYSGKLLVTDLGRRWSPWNRTLNCADMCTRPLLNGNPGTAKTIVFGGGNGLAIGSGSGYGNLYTLDTYDYFPLNPSLGTWNCADDDYGVIPMYYVTYFFFNHDIEQQPQLGQFRKIFPYVAVHAVGIGSIKLTPIIDALQNTQTPLPLTPLSLTDPGFDLEFHPITKGNRVAYRIEPYIGSPGVAKALALTHLIVSARKDMVFPVRGTIFSG